MPPERYSDLAALVGETSRQPARRARGRPKTAAKWIAQYGDLDGVVAHVDEIKGKAGESLREHLDGVLRNRRLNQLVERPRPARSTIDDLERARTGTASRCTRSSTASSSGSCATASSRTSRPPQEEAEDGFDVDGALLAPTRCPAWLRRARRAPARRVGVHRRRHLGAAAPATPAAVAAATAGGAAAYLDADPARRGEADAAVAAWLADARRAQGAARRQGAAAGARRPRLGPRRASRPTPRSRPTSCGPTSAPTTSTDLVLRHLGRELQAEDGRRGGQGMLDFGADDDAAAARRDGARPRGARPRRRRSTSSSRPPAAPSCCATSSCRSSTSSPAWSAPASPSTSRALTELEADFAAKVRAGPAGRLRRHRRRADQPRLAQAAAGGALRHPRHAQDEAHQDRLHHRRRRADRPVRQDRAPVPRGAAAPPRRRPAAGHRRGPASSRSPTTGASTRPTIQTIAATGRLSSTDPNLQNVPIRTEEGRRIREVFVVGEGYESLMSADYSQIEMRIMAHLSGDEGLIEAFRTGEDLHRFVGSRVFGVEPDDVTPGDAQQGQGDVLRPGLRPVGVRAVQAADHLHRGGAGPDGRVLRSGSAGCATTCARSSPRPAATGYTADDARPAPLPARPDLRQPPAPRDGRADGAQRPDPGLGRRHHQARDAAASTRRCADAGLRSRMLLQVHDELVLEVAPGERDDVEALVRREMGGAVEHGRAARRQRRGRAAAGTTRRTSPVRRWADPETAPPARTNDRHGSYADHGVSSATSAVNASPCSILLGNQHPPSMPGAFT